jgi:SAM-dependent methyltransferase
MDNINKAKNEYDSNPKGYVEATKRPLRKFAYEPTIKKLLDDLEGKEVLDLACGDGMSSRFIKSLGAKKVVGLDISEKLINIARQNKDPDIEYFIENVFSEDILKYGKYDVVTGIMIVHYAESKKLLEKLFQGIFKVLKPGGVFYALTVNPDLYKTGYENYGVRISGVINEGESSKVELHDFSWKKYCEFTNYYWTKNTYKSALENSGFDIEWVDGAISEEGINTLSLEYWKRYFDQPIYLGIKAKK